MLHVTPMTAADWRRVRAIRLRALESDPDAFATTLAEERARPEASWRERLENPAARTFVASDGGADLGLVTGGPWSGRPGVAGLFAMWVAPEARGRGLGDALVGAVIDWAREADFAHLALEVADENGPAIALYARHGFEPTGRSGSLPPPREHVTEHERVLELGAERAP